jgi:2-dehydropantoate 2-reductase
MAVLGTGANGATVGADLVNAGYDVTFIEQWPAHVEAIRRDGIRVEFADRAEVTRIDNVLHLCQVAEVTQPFDIVFLMLKAYDTRWGCELIKPLLASDGLVVGVQNGMTVDDIADVVGPERTMGTVIEISSTMYEPGIVERHSPRDRSWFAVGAIDPAVRRRESEVAELLGHVGIAELSDDIRSSKWMKLVINAAELVPSAVLGLPIADAARVPEMGDIMVEAGNEALSAALAGGNRIVPIFGLEDVDPDEPDQYVDRLIDKLLSDYVLPHTESTVLQDWTRGRRSEVDQINGLVVRMHEEHGSVAPANSAVAAVAHRIEQGQIAPDPSNLDQVLSLRAEHA